MGERVKLTEAQRMVLRTFAEWENGRPAGARAVAWAPVRRMIRRGYLAKTGHTQDRARYSITPAGRQALKDHPLETEQ